MNKLSHADLVKIGHRWLKNRCSITFCEFGIASAMEMPDCIGWRGTSSTLIECKASRADFLADAGKLFRIYPDWGMGQQRYFMCPKGMIAKEELPMGWGLLWVQGSRVFIQKDSDAFEERSQRNETAFLVSMLRRVQVRLGEVPITEWLRYDNLRKAKEEVKP